MLKNAVAVLAVGVSLLSFTPGCKRKVAFQPPPPPPKPEVRRAPTPAPSIRFSAEPDAVQKGQAATLRWTVEHATEVSINGIGTVPESGSRQVFPPSTTTFTLMAKGPGGTADATATVNVTVPPPPPAAVAPKAAVSLSSLIEKYLSDAYFDFDKSDIRQDARAALTKDAGGIKEAFSEVSGGAVEIEGHCDERGSAEYNLALGDRRANAARQFLIEMGVPADRLKTISYGKERPQCTEHNETCWQENRRAHFSDAR